MAARVAVPTIFQHMPHRSGACALGMILAHYGRHLSRYDLHLLCGDLLTPSHLAPLIKAAHLYGLDAAAAAVGADEALQGPVPAIVILDDHHFAVLEGSEDGKVFLNLPKDGPTAVEPAEFARRFAGQRITLKPGPKFTPGEPPPSLAALVGRELQGGVGAIVVVVLTSVALLLPNLAVPAFTQIFIDQVLLRGLSDWLFPIVVGLTVCVLYVATATSIQQYFMKRLERNIAVTTVSRMFWRCLSAPVLYFTHVPVGDVTSRLVGASRLATLLSGRIGTNFSNLVTALFYIAVLLLYSAQLGSICLALTLLNVLVAHRVDRKRGALNSQQLQQVAQVYGGAVSGFKAIETLKAMGMESFFFRKQAELSVRTIGNEQHVDSLSQILNLAPQVLTALNTAIILTLGAVFVIEGKLSVGELIAFQMLAGRFAKPVQDLMASTQEIQELKARLSSCDEILRAPTDPVAEPRTGTAPARRLSGHIELKGIFFAYNLNDPPLIENLSLSITPGARVALVGGSGSGKSTLGRIALGLYQPTGGTVLYDGLAVDDVPRPIWAASVGYVSQEVSLFEGTVRENITLWDETIPLEDVRQAAKDAEIDDVITQRPGAYDSPVAEGGANFSGGQRQRIEIARALVRNPRILLLDEATSALDSETEMLIDRNLRRRGCTCLIIAHRLSTLRDADEIIVLDRGKVVERGSHDELIRADGRYSQLVKLA